MRRSLLAAAVLLSACGSNEKSTTIDGTTYTADDSKGTATIKTENGSVHTTSGDATAKVDMPEYAPRYPGSAIEGTIETENDGAKTRMVTASTADPIGKVVDFYKGALAKAGWSVPSSMVTGDSALLAGKKGEQQVSIVISREEEKTNIIITLPNG